MHAILLYWFAKNSGKWPKMAKTKVVWKNSKRKKKKKGLEKRIFENAGYQPYLWLRILDDIFCIWTDGLEKLQEFFKFQNAFHPKIKFTMDCSYENINFSDVQVSKKEFNN